MVDANAPPAHILSALRARNAALYKSYTRHDDRVSHWLVHGNAAQSRLEDIAWVALLDYGPGDDHEDFMPVLHHLVEATESVQYPSKDPISCAAYVAQKRAMLLHVLRLPGINLEVRMGTRLPGNGWITALECGIYSDCFWAITQLLKAGADTVYLDHFDGDYINKCWFAPRAACVAALIAFLNVNRKRHLMPRDVWRIMARMLWEERYEGGWLDEENEQKHYRGF